MCSYSYMYKECHFYLKKEETWYLCGTKQDCFFFLLFLEEELSTKTTITTTLKAVVGQTSASGLPFSSSRGFVKIKKEILILRTLSKAPLFIYRFRLDVKKWEIYVKWNLVFWLRIFALGGRKEAGSLHVHSKSRDFILCIKIIWCRGSGEKLVVTLSEKNIT